MEKTFYGVQKGVLVNDMQSNSNCFLQNSSFMSNSMLYAFCDRCRTLVKKLLVLPLVCGWQ